MNLSCKYITRKTAVGETQHREKVPGLGLDMGGEQEGLLGSARWQWVVADFATGRPESPYWRK